MYEVEEFNFVELAKSVSGESLILGNAQCLWLCSDTVEGQAHSHVLFLEDMNPVYESLLSGANKLQNASPLHCSV